MHCNVSPQLQEMSSSVFRYLRRDKVSVVIKLVILAICIQV
jgi:hypothetical protein